MKQFFRLMAALFLSLALSLAGLVPPAAARGKAPERIPTILISIDGLRPDYISPALTPNLAAIAAKGVSGTMTPSFPSITFPNHWTLATGLRPDRHGIINGAMSDPAHPGVIFGKSSEQPWWWDGSGGPVHVEPIWVAAERAHIRSGIMFWPGSTTAIDGTRASDWQAYHADLPNHERAEVVLDWMRRPANIRPGLALLYFGDVDVNGHRHGPGSPETIAAIRDVDAAIGYLRRGLATMHRRVNMVIVSDHGMAHTIPDHVIWLKDYVAKEDYALVSYGGILFINNVPGHEAKLAESLKKMPGFIHCWRKGELPERFHYGHNPRVPDWLCLPDPGARIMDGNPEHPDDGGDHGYDPASPDMRALFLATGPAFRPGTHLPVFDNVAIEPLLRRLIGLAPGKDRDGTAAPVAKALR
ncbi:MULTISPECIES: alkaline phosphatase family protein [unclassified Novosphingobium]|uniref:alkaline phosphatase family protein n=1 Tax=unclassified Novosphingobium TaxID=2644732 RepID=UPI000869221B|nr:MULTISPECIES: ectonucleotide pyrophosphatase/phosphodiesterase [unclassified Novosphingobium]MBN9143481.1 alkaline phosphatase family protein [Novosphingobium sp.]MDR6706730.1 putative AlkP superfamily pyrophosphatase or phosphodiesterase [Novosphingobium sp. 1748]ODU83869.1 MAG: hypothetical protein ABT10_05710 [Novosphingobium sp. SCN 63-17]OJX93113.1 MAG: hypothetical protein BGP00_22210 [Novosphingobium sp. 63-713]